MFGRRDRVIEFIHAQREESAREHESTRASIAAEARALREENARRHEEFLVYAEETRRLREKDDERTRELREFNREILLRNEKVYTAAIAQLEELGRQAAKGRREAEEGRRQLEANTKAVLSVLDRLNGSGGAKG